MNGIEFTCLFAFSAGDASDFTVLHGVSRAVVGVAGNSDSGVDGHGFDEVLRTGLDAGTAVGAFVLIDDGDAVSDDDGIKVTDSHTCAKSQTSVGTGFRSSSRKCGSTDAVHDAMILVFVLGLVAVSVAFDVSHHDFLGIDLDTHDFTDLVCHRISSYGAQCRRSSIKGYTLGVGFTSCKSASAAVYTRQYQYEFFHSGVLFHFKYICGVSEKKSQKKSDASKNRYWYNNFHHLTSP